MNNQPYKQRQSTRQIPGTFGTLWCYIRRRINSVSRCLNQRYSVVSINRYHQYGITPDMKLLLPTKGMLTLQTHRPWGFKEVLPSSPELAQSQVTPPGRRGRLSPPKPCAPTAAELLPAQAASFSSHATVTLSLLRKVWAPLPPAFLREVAMAAVSTPSSALPAYLTRARSPGKWGRVRVGLSQNSHRVPAQARQRSCTCANASYLQVPENLQPWHVGI